MSRTKSIILIFFAFIFGVFWASTFKSLSETREITKEVIREVCPKETLWKQLKETDDRGFALAAEGFTIVSDIFDAIANFDLAKAKSYSQELEGKTAEVNSIAKERQLILTKLGY